MNLDEVIDGWRSQDASTFYGVVDKTRLHQVLRQEQAKLEKQSRRATWGGYIFGVAPLLISSGLLLAIMFQPNYDDVLIVWDYVVGIVGVAASIVVAVTLSALRRAQRAHEQGFGDSLRDQLRRRIAQIDYEATDGRRLTSITLAAGLICAWAIPVAQQRIAHVPVPYSEFHWSPLPIVLIFGFIYLLSRRSAPRERKLSRKRQLDALLKELDGE
jgi:hypothetical protein